MNFEDFRKDIESKLNSKVKFELQEFSFLPHSFGSGILAYRILGQNHKFIYDGRDNELAWLISKPHQKYSEENYVEFEKFEGLVIGEESLWKGIKTAHNSGLAK